MLLLYPRNSHSQVLTPNSFVAVSMVGVRPWIVVGLEKNAKKGEFVKGTIEYNNFVQTTYAKAYNSFKVPTFAGYVILGSFGLLIISIASYRMIRIYLIERISESAKIYNTKIERFLRRRLIEAPTIGKRHAQAYGSGLFTIRAPLRVHVALLSLLFLANIVPLTAFYDILDPQKNTTWPNNRYAAQSRYLADRAGVLAVAHLPLLFILGGRNSPAIFLTGCSFNTLMLYHRWIGRLITLLALIHGIAYTAYLSSLHTYSSYWQKYTWFDLGALALVFFVLIIFTAHTQIIRQRAYDIFIVVHAILVIVAVAALHWHILLLDSPVFHDFLIWIYASIAFWALDRALRLMRILLFNVDLRIKKGQVFSVGRIERWEYTEVLKITVSIPKTARYFFQSTHYAGSHFYLYFPTLQPITSHPFSLLQHRQIVDDQGHEDTLLVFGAKINQGITKTLGEKYHNTTITVLLDGPYGVRHRSVNFSNVFLFSMGIGITNVLSLTDGILRAHFEEKRFVQLIWCIRSFDMISVAIDIFEEIQALLKSEKVQIRISILVHVVECGTKYEQSNANSPSINEKRIAEPSRTDAQLAQCKQNASIDPIDCKKKNRSGSEKQHGDRKTTLRSEEVRLDQDIYARVQNLINASTNHFELTVFLARADLTQIINEQVTTKDAIFACGGDKFLDEVRAASLQVEASYFEEPFSW